MAEYYVFLTEAEAHACIDYINGTEWFPCIGQRDGQPAVDKAKTTKWADSPVELASGEWAVPRVSASLMDYVGVPQESRDAFCALFGSHIRELSAEDFPSVEEVSMYNMTAADIVTDTP